MKVFSFFIPFSKAHGYGLRQDIDKTWVKYWTVGNEGFDNLYVKMENSMMMKESDGWSLELQDKCAEMS